MTTPLQFANEYRNLTVAFDDGPGTVRIERYHEGGWDKEADRLIDDVMGDFQQQKKKNPGYALTLTVSGKGVAFKDANVLRRCLHYAFEGKGSPEDCQVGAQLAVLRKRTTKANLQRYCDDHVGLDCNGFVGNYLWYRRDHKAWPDMMPVENQGPNALINDLVFTGTTPVAGLGSLQSAALNIFALLDGHNRVVAKDSSAAHAHIVISEPGKFTPSSFVTNSFGGLDPVSGIWGHPALWCVESTGPQGQVGLKDDWYALTEVLDTKTNKIQSVHGHAAYKAFRVYRASKKGTNKEWGNFTIGSLSPTA